METTGAIFEIRRFCVHDGPGIRTTVFLLGCSLDCSWCQNPEGRSRTVETFDLRTDANIAQLRTAPTTKPVGCVVSVSTVMAEVCRDRTFYDQSGGGVTFSGGEPMEQVEFLDALLRASKDAGLHTAVDTCGYAPFESFEQVYDSTDMFLFDLKLMDPHEHLEYTGVPNELILNNLSRLAALGDKVRLRIPLVPGVTDTDRNLSAILRFLEPLSSVRRVSLLPYNELGEDKIDRYQLARERLNLKRQPNDDLQKIASRFVDLGCDVTIGG
jgi:pyruvate formate lyase activating enzyme